MELQERQQDIDELQQAAYAKGVTAGRHEQESVAHEQLRTLNTQWHIKMDEKNKVVEHQLSTEYDQLASSLQEGFRYGTRGLPLPAFSILTALFFLSVCFSSRGSFIMSWRPAADWSRGRCAAKWSKQPSQLATSPTRDGHLTVVAWSSSSWHAPPMHER